MRRDSFTQTLLVAGVLCAVCSVLVASAAVGLRGRQEFNKELDQKKNVLLAAGLTEGVETPQDVDNVFAEHIERELVNLETGKPLPEGEVDLETYDQREAARNKGMSDPVEPPNALGGIKRRAKYAFAFLVKDETGKLDQVVLPINGKGLWSTLYGFISVDSDGKTVRGITFYEHKETPGLGGEVDNPQWKALWDGKKVYDKQGQVELHLIKGTVDPEAPQADFEVDGLSGATLTSRGVTQLVQYWLGPEAFGPYLKNVTSGDGG